MSGNKSQRPDEETRREESPSFKERRKKPDFIVRMTTILSLLSWAFALMVWVTLDLAKPEKARWWEIQNNIAVRSKWDVALLPTAYGLLISSLALCLLAFVFNTMRRKRKTDKYKKSVFIIGIIDIIGLVLFLIVFGRYFLW